VPKWGCGCCTGRVVTFSTRGPLPCSNTSLCKMVNDTGTAVHMHMSLKRQLWHEAVAGAHCLSQHAHV
jgi:hypothetical protein